MIFNHQSGGGGKQEYVTATYKSGAYHFAFMSSDGISTVARSGGTYQVLKNSICTIGAGANVSGGIKALFDDPYGIYGYEVTGDFTINFGEPS